MQGSTNRVVQKIKKVSFDCASIHGMIHREELILKTLLQENI